ncbi:hypothetical protein ABZ471_07625 [Streptomyces sp. NPDC005728]|uniref:hypothetical protein n=1 Tax=Streptomyces sp. NPDC005728 TaxID=3157054 RepID=UPI003400F3F1
MRHSGAATADTLKTERAKGRQGPWRVVWSVRVTDHRCTPHGDGDNCEPYDTVLDAGTGEIYGW